MAQPRRCAREETGEGGCGGRGSSPATEVAPWKGTKSACADWEWRGRESFQPPSALRSEISDLRCCLLFSVQPSHDLSRARTILLGNMQAMRGRGEAARPAGAVCSLSCVGSRNAHGQRCAREETGVSATAQVGRYFERKRSGPRSVLAEKRAVFPRLRISNLSYREPSAVYASRRSRPPSTEIT